MLTMDCFCNQTCNMNTWSCQSMQEAPLRKQNHNQLCCDSTECQMWPCNPLYSVRISIHSQTFMKPFKNLCTYALFCFLWKSLIETVTAHKLFSEHPSQLCQTPPPEIPAEDQTRAGVLPGVCSQWLLHRDQLWVIWNQCMDLAIEGKSAVISCSGPAQKQCKESHAAGSTGGFPWEDATEALPELVHHQFRFGDSQDPFWSQNTASGLLLILLVFTGVLLPM